MALTTRPRPASALLAVAVLVGLLGPVAAPMQVDAEPASRHGVAAPPLHARQLLVGGRDLERGALVEAGRRQVSARAGGWVADVAALASAAPGSRCGRWWSAGAAGARSRPRRAWSRAPPFHLQPI
jgi:hypothetical protein